MRAREYLAVAALAIAGLVGGLTACGSGSTSAPQPSSSPTSQSNQGYENPSVAAAAIKRELQQKLADPGSPVYWPGDKVQSVICAPAGDNTYSCQARTSLGFADNYVDKTVPIVANYDAAHLVWHTEYHGGS